MLRMAMRKREVIEHLKTLAADKANAEGGRATQTTGEQIASL